MSLEVKGEELGRMERNGTLFPVGFGKGVGDSCWKCCLGLREERIRAGRKETKGIMGWAVHRLEICCQLVSMAAGWSSAAPPSFRLPVSRTDAQEALTLDSTDSQMSE